MPTLEDTEIDQARQYFDRTHRHVLDVTNALTEAQWHFKPAAEQWSIAENLEHLVAVQDRILSAVLPNMAEAPAPPQDRDYRAVDAIILEKITDRSVRAKAPEFLNPAGALAPAQALERLGQNYRRLAEYVESTPDLRGHHLESPPLRVVTNGAHTMMDGYQWAICVAAHDERHVRQMLEVKQSAGWPE